MEEETNYTNASSMSNGISGLDSTEIKEHINDMTEKFIKFVMDEVKHTDVPNAFIPVLASGALNIINVIPFILGSEGSSDEYIQSVKKEILNIVSEDFDISLTNGKSVSLDGKTIN